MSDDTPTFANAPDIDEVDELVHRINNWATGRDTRAVLGACISVIVTALVNLPDELREEIDPAGLFECLLADIEEWQGNEQRRARGNAPDEHS
jgi:hypothetical protein